MEMSPPLAAPRTGLAVWSLVLGCLGFFSLGVLGLVGVALGHVALNRIRRAPLVHGGEGLAVAGISVGWASFLVSFSVLSRIMVPPLARVRTHEYELSAISQISTLHTAETQYYSQFGRFASNLGELGPAAADLIPADLARGVKGGYRFALTGSPTGYTIQARPVSYPDRGRRTFFSDQTMIIRESWDPVPASIQSPEIR